MDLFTVYYINDDRELNTKFYENKQQLKVELLTTVLDCFTSITDIIVKDNKTYKKSFFDCNENNEQLIIKILEF